MTDKKDRGIVDSFQGLAMTFDEIFTSEFKLAPHWVDIKKELPKYERYDTECVLVLTSFFDVIPAYVSYEKTSSDIQEEEVTLKLEFKNIAKAYTDDGEIVSIKNVTHWADFKSLVDMTANRSAGTQQALRYYLSRE